MPRSLSLLSSAREFWVSLPCEATSFYVVLDNPLSLILPWILVSLSIKIYPGLGHVLTIFIAVNLSHPSTNFQDFLLKCIPNSCLSTSFLLENAQRKAARSQGSMRLQGVALPNMSRFLWFSGRGHTGLGFSANNFDLLCKLSSFLLVVPVAQALCEKSWARLPQR